MMFSGVCAAGREADWGGKWDMPCPDPSEHVIGAPGMPTVELCGRHFSEIFKAGLVKEPNIGQDEFRRRGYPGYEDPQ